MDFLPPQIPVCIYSKSSCSWSWYGRVLLLGFLLILSFPNLFGQRNEEEPPSRTDEEGQVIPDLLNWPALPEWTREELELLQTGELELGTALFREIGEDHDQPLFQATIEPEDTAREEEEEIEAIEPLVIGEEFLKPYFAGRPGSYLVDPQGMLSMQQLKDRESFLELHAGDSKVDLYLYLFDKKQIVPPEGQIERIFKDHFLRGNGLTAVVYYYMGDPGRAKMVVSPDVYSGVSESMVKGALIYARQEAQKMSEPSSQLESFSTGLSIRLYWIEREIIEASGEEQLLQEVAAEDEITVVDAETVREVLPTDHTQFFYLLGVLVAAVLLGGIIALIFNRRRRRSYLFPEIEMSSLLGAPHAAGVGSVIHFGDTALPPSVQKEQVPDYLQEI